MPIASVKCSLLLVFCCVLQSQGMQLNARLTGKVADGNGKPLEGITVVLQPDNRRALTNASGEFNIGKLFEGTYSIAVNAVGFEPYESEIDVKNGVNSISIMLKPGSNVLKEVNIGGIHSNPDNFIDMTRTAMPSKVISRQEIEMMGSRRLDEVLKEQTGLAIINDIGSGNRAVGLQLQGFDSGYTMIMIDGQPMVGRNNGNLDLSRITVSNIERIEIIKGASSCLFGSEALAGVVNIVTRKNITQPQGLAALRYGSFNMVDATLEGETPFAGSKGSAYLSGNYYRTDGFNSNPYLDKGKTAPPFDSFALQGRGRYLLNEISTLSVSGRFVSRQSDNRTAYEGLSATIDSQEEYDINSSVSLNNNFRNGMRLKTQYYLTRYQTAQDIADVATGIVMPGSRFKQNLHRAELQTARQLGHSTELTGGAGVAYELLDNTVYRGSKNMINYFAYGQGSWQIVQNLSATAGARYDYHNKYGSKVNPSLGLRYDLLTNLSLRGAVGTGFKTPNFQQLYLVFNNMQAGYLVFGAEEFWREIRILQDAGQITNIFPVANRIGALKPERSVSYSAGFAYAPVKRVKLDVNVFYNDMRNFINYEQVALKANGQQVFSYMNIARAYTSGTEIGLSIPINRSFSLSAGYQLLYAIDKGVVDSISNGTGIYGLVYDRDVNAQRTATRKDYFGMSNRSRHMANIKLSYANEATGVSGSFRVNYRSKYGFMEANRANNFLDPWDSFVPSFFLLNLALQKNFYNKHMQLQLTADNLMNYRDQKMPVQMGRAVLAGVSWRFYKD